MEKRDVRKAKLLKREGVEGGGREGGDGGGERREEVQLEQT